MNNKNAKETYYEAINRKVDHKVRELRQEMRELAMEGLECNYF
jgi:hypothetical protein